MSEAKRFRENDRGVAAPLFGWARIEYGLPYQDVREELAGLPKEKVMALILMVACDKVVGEWSDRSGTTDCMLIKQVRELARGLSLPVSNKDEFSITSIEARGYFLSVEDEGLDFLTEAELNPIDVYCTLRRCLNAVVGRAVRPQERSGYHLTAWGGGEVDLDYVLQPGAEWVFLEG